MAVSPRTTARTSTARTSTARTSTARTDALATPWSATSIRRPAPVAVTFSDLAATRTGAVGRSQVLQTPFGSRQRPATPPPVDFSSLPAPIPPTRRPEPLTIRSAFVPRPRATLSGAR